jgi:FMN reductase
VTQPCVSRPWVGYTEAFGLTPEQRIKTLFDRIPGTHSCRNGPCLWNGLGRVPLANYTTGCIAFWSLAMSLRIVGLAGSLSRPSKTRALVDLVTTRAAAALRASAATFDLTDLQPGLGAAQTLNDLEGLPRALVASILSADALVVGSPVYKGSYTGLFKHLFDLIDPAALAGKPVLLTATGGGDKHALVIEHQLRPLFGFFEAITLPTGIYACGADFTDGVPASPTLLARIDRAVCQFTKSLQRLPEATAA